MSPGATIARDKRIRRRLLKFLDGAKVSDGGGLTGRTLLDLVEYSAPPAERLEDDDHLLRLMRDLVLAGLAKEIDQRTRKDQRQSIDFLYYTLTFTGSALLNEQLPPNAMVEDERRTKNPEP